MDRIDESMDRYSRYDRFAQKARTKDIEKRDMELDHDSLVLLRHSVLEKNTLR